MKKFKLLCVALSLVGRLCAGDIFEGIVVETLHGGGYTYLQIEDAQKKYWIAVESIKIDKGVEVRFTEELRAKNFESKSLNRVFDEIMFASNLQYRTKTPESGNLALIKEVVKVSPYQQKETMSVEQAMIERTQLADKTIKIRGKVVKVSMDIMERNWIHIQDGTGENGEVGRVVFTSKETPKVGDIVIASGIVRIDKNFGSGYVYKIIVENAHFKN